MPGPQGATKNTMATQTSAVEAVLGNDHLLEHILSFLSTRDLLLAQRISRAVHSSITESSRLQRRLFFKPDDRRPNGEQHAADRRLNPLLQHTFGPWFVDGRLWRSGFGEIPHAKSRDGMQVLMRPEAR